MTDPDSKLPDEPTTFYERGKRPNDLGEKPTNEIPKLPSNSPWASDPVPPEPPLGHDNNETR
jgi:hypothetical protein